MDYQKADDIVILEYKDLIEGKDLSQEIEKAFGWDGLGLLAVRGVPNFLELRQKLLPLSRKFALLPEEIKKKYEHEKSFYSFGWSHGKEKMSSGVPDYSKGSYYANPLHNKPYDDEKLIEKHAPFCHPNIWPTEIPEMESAFMNLGKLMVDTGSYVAKQCDSYVHKVNPNYPLDKLYTICKEGKTPKGRLLHYFPLDETSQPASSNQSLEVEMASWCGWHNDHGSLTGLVPAMWFTPEGEEIEKCPDPDAGLYIKTRKGRIVKAAVPKDCMPFQIGESAMIHSGGILQATPHGVRGAKGEASKGISRETLAVFMEPDFDYPMDLVKGRTEDDLFKGSTSEHLPPGVPLLKTRWRPNQDFDNFTELTLKSYYSD